MDELRIKESTTETALMGMKEFDGLVMKPQRQPSMLRPHHQ
jgi:hypothetical protein